MTVEINMPKLTDTMEEGTIVRWLKHVGDRVEVGDVVAEVETDKAAMELEAFDAGVLQEIKIDEGASAPVGAVIAVLGDGGQAAAPSPKPAAAPAVLPAKPAPVASPPDVRPVPEPRAEPDHLRSSPLARKVAQEMEVDLARVAGTGPGGRITRRDVQAAAAAAPAKVAAASPSAAPVPSSGRVELSKRRLAIARRMADASREIPHFFVTSEIDMGDAMRLRRSLETTGVLTVPISVTHVLIKAVALALQRHPRLNAAWDDGAVRFSDAVNIGIATAVDDGLIVPVIKGCERLSLADIAAAARQLNEKAKGGRFGADEMMGATFTISNLGMLDVDEFSAIIMPPNAAILAVGAVKERAVARDGQLAVARTMRVTLSCDHRILNGVEAARFLEELKRLLENPVALLVAEAGAA